MMQEILWESAMFQKFGHIKKGSGQRTQRPESPPNPRASRTGSHPQAPRRLRALRRSQRRGVLERGGKKGEWKEESEHILSSRFRAPEGTASPLSRPGGFWLRDECEGKESRSMSYPQAQKDCEPSEESERVGKGVVGVEVAFEDDLKLRI